MSEHEAERIGPTSGRFAGVVGVVLSAVLGLGVLLDGWDRGDLPVLLAAALAGVVAWAVLLRPSVIFEPSDLVLRNMLSTTRVPHAAVDEVEVRHVLTVLAGGTTVHSTAVNRRRERGIKIAARRAYGSAPSAPKVPTVADLVEARIRRRSEDARATGGAGAAVVRRSWDWPVVVLLVLPAVALVAALLA